MFLFFLLNLAHLGRKLIPNNNFHWRSHIWFTGYYNNRINPYNFLEGKNATSHINSSSGEGVVGMSWQAPFIRTLRMPFYVA